jgi:hypothetical protein
MLKTYLKKIINMFIFNIFGKKNNNKEHNEEIKSNNNEKDIDKRNAIIVINEKINKQEKRINEINNIIKDLEIRAKVNLKKGNREYVKRILSKKRKYIKHLRSFENAISIFENHKLLIENAILKKDVIETIKKGNDIMKDIYKDNNINKIEDIKNEVEEIKDEINEIDEIFEENNEDAEIIEDEIKQMESDIVNEDLNVGNEISKLNTKEKLQKQEDELKNYVVN